MIRSGPPRLSLFGLPGADELANVVEYFVHHEDVRRARRGADEPEVPLVERPRGVEVARLQGDEVGAGGGHVLLLRLCQSPDISQAMSEC